MSYGLKSIQKSSVVSYMSALLNAIANTIIPVLLVNNLSVEEFGAYKLIFSLILIASVTTSFGLESVIGRFVPEFVTKKKYHLVTRILFIAVLIRLLCVLLFIATIWNFKELVFGFFNMPEIFNISFWVILILIGIIMTKRVIGPAFLNALLKQYLDYYNNIMYFAAKIVLFSFALYYGYGLKGVIISWFIAELISIIHYLIFAFIITSRFNKKESIDGNNIKYKRYIRFGLYNFMSSSIVIFGDLYIDNLIIAKYLSLNQVGIYAFAGSIVGLVLMTDPSRILKSIFSTMLIVEYGKTNNLQLLFKRYQLLNKVALFFFIPATTGTLFLCDKIIAIVFNIDYINSISVLYILLPFYYFRTILGPLSHLIGVLEKNHLYLLGGFSSLYNLIMNLLLVEKFGIIGIAWATSSAMLINYLLCFIGMKYYYNKGIKFPLFGTVKIIINSIPMILTIVFLKDYVVGIVSLFFIILISVVVYFISNLLNTVFNVDESALINKAIGRKIFQV